MSESSDFSAVYARVKHRELLERLKRDAYEKGTAIALEGGDPIESNFLIDRRLYDLIKDVTICEAKEIVTCAQLGFDAVQEAASSVQYALTRFIEESDKLKEEQEKI